VIATASMAFRDKVG